MTVETVIYKELVDDAGVGALAGDRIYPLVAPQDVAMPYIVYERLAQDLEYDHSGPIAVQTAPFRLTIGAESYASAAEVEAAIATALDVPVVGDGSVRIFGVFLSGADDNVNLETGTFARTVMAEVVYGYTG